MAYTYLDLCNKVLRQVNEVPLQSANFQNSGGFHASVRDAVNYALQDINRAEFQWPFNRVVATQVLTVDQQFYDLPSDYKVVDWNTFYLRPTNSPKTSGRPLRLVSYDFWHGNFRTNDNKVKNEPMLVAPTQGEQFVISPTPDKAYTVEFEYWSMGQDLENATDVPNVPERFSNVIVEGALMWAYRFRDNIEQAQTMEQRFERSIKEMRTILINKYQRVYAGIPHVSRGGFE